MSFLKLHISVVYHINFLQNKNKNTPDALETGIAVKPGLPCYATAQSIYGHKYIGTISTILA